MIDRLNLEKTIEIIESTGFFAFPSDIGKDEIEKNHSFFIFIADGDIHKGSTNTQYLREFVLSFITKNNVKLDDLKLINDLENIGLFFKSSSTRYGEIRNTEHEAKMITFTFTRPIRVC